MVTPSSPATLLHRLEHGDPAELIRLGFGHREHLAVAWELVEREALGHAIERLATALRRVVTSLCVPNKYNETLTWAWMVIVAQRRAESPEGEDFEAFIERNPDLLDHQSTLAAYYDPAQLQSPAARRRFLLPSRDRGEARG